MSRYTSDIGVGSQPGYRFNVSRCHFKYNSNISGMLWRSVGDWENRKYNFSYDAAGRLLKADFTQFANASSQYDLSGGIDYSVKLGDGVDPNSAYDANGNIKKMLQKGFKAGGSITIDDLTYNYANYSNTLSKVTDAVNDVNSKMGDFKEPASTTGDDYAYDSNGNLTSDKTTTHPKLT